MKKLKKKRYIFNIKTIVELYSQKNIIELAINKINQEYNLDLTKYETGIIERENQIGFYLNWHIDDCAIFKHNEDSKENTNNTLFDDKFFLYHKKNCHHLQ
jgi:hypothetical protein